MKNLLAFDFLCKYSIFYEDCIISCEKLSEHTYCIRITGDVLPTISITVFVTSYSVHSLTCSYLHPSDIHLYPDELIRWSPCIMHKVRNFDNFMRFVKISLIAWNDRLSSYVL